MTRPRVAIVGAGVAGAVVAATLAPHCELVVIEAGGASVPPTDPREAMTRSVGFLDEPYPAGVGLGGGSRINGLVLEHAEASYWQELAASHGVPTFAEANVEEVTTRFVGEEVSRIGPLDELLLNAHPWARPAHLATRNGVRLTAWDRAWTRAEHVVRLDSEVERIVLRGSRARSVRLRGGEEVEADHVILCAGVVGSAALAMRSGVGGASVGRRLLDHPSVFVPVAVPTVECPTFVGALGYESDVLTMSMNPTRSAIGGFLLGLMRTSSTGSVTLDGDTVVIDRKMRDDVVVREQMVRAIARLNEMLSHVSVSVIEDGDAVLSSLGEAMWHGVGTMHMGSDDEAVTDCNGLVRGTQNVWCMDASVFPVVPPVPTQGPTMVAASVLASGFLNSVST
jgi:choline dehydrogenase-like flavoprotein